MVNEGETFVIEFIAQDPIGSDIKRKVIVLQ
jgi:hypothetical protein